MIGRSSRVVAAIMATALTVGGAVAADAAPLSEVKIDSCTNDQIRVTHRHVGAALSHAGVRVIFTNHSPIRCSLFGYPGAAAVNARGRQFRQAERTTNGYLAGRDKGKPRTVVLGPGRKAMSIIEGTAMNTDGRVKPCQAGRALLVTPPNTTHSTRIRFRNYFCDLEVHPVVRGAGLRAS